jgi:hypothetical protein
VTKQKWAAMQLNSSIMKRIHWIQLVGINLLFVVAIILPFLPGPSNQIVIGLSGFGQFAGFFGLLLVPVGMAWLIVEIKTVAIVATAIIVAIYLLMTLGLSHDVGLMAGIGGLLPAAFVLSRTIQSNAALFFNHPIDRIHCQIVPYGTIK